MLKNVDQAFAWTELLVLAATHSPAAKTGYPPFGLALMLRIDFMQQWLYLFDRSAEMALFETGFCNHFMGLSGTERIANWVSTQRFRRLLEDHDLSL